MKKYTIQIRDNKGKHVKRMTIYSRDIFKTIERIEEMEERQTFIKLKIDELLKRQHNQNLKYFIESDLFDKEAVGSDISYEDFLENEIWFEVKQ